MLAHSNRHSLYLLLVLVHPAIGAEPSTDPAVRQGQTGPQTTARGDEPAAKGASDKQPYIGFEYDYRTNFGVLVVRDPRGKPVNKQLTFDTSGQTNGNLLRIDGKDFEYGTSVGKLVEEGKADQNPSTSVWTAGNVEVRQVLEIKPGKTGKLDTLFVSYALSNKDSKPHTVGMRVMIDSAIGTPENDGVPFRYAGGKDDLVTTFKDFPVESVPEWVEALEKPNAKDPGTITILTLKTDGVEAPGRASITAWPGAAPADWDIPVTTFSPEGAGARKDSSLVLYWQPKELKPGEKRTVGYAYGTQDVETAKLPKSPPVTAKLSTGGPSAGKKEVAKGKDIDLGKDPPQPKTGPKFSVEVPKDEVRDGLLKISRTTEDARRRAPAIELVLDSSGSMKDEVEGQAKYLIARKVMHGLVDELPEAFDVGLRLFGHGGFAASSSTPVQTEDKRWLSDSQLVVGLSSLDKAHRQKIKDAIDAAKPRALTPLVHSLLEARKDFPAEGRGPKIVVLVSDGMETCGGKIEDVAAAYQQDGIEAVVNVVGFDVTGDERKQLESIAKAGKGTYFNARTAKELTAALSAAVKIGYVVLDEKGQKEVAQGQVNGPAVRLRPGKYQVRLQGAKTESLTVHIDSGVTRELTWNAAGKLSQNEAQTKQDTKKDQGK